MLSFTVYSVVETLMDKSSQIRRILRQTARICGTDIRL